jgi:cardiolipin synthase
VFVTTPYFVPDEPILAALTTAALRGVDVRVLVPKRSDSRLVAAAARSYYDQLVGAGVMVYEYGPRMLHAKTLVADTMALVGTANMDNRSFRLNFEVLAAIYDGATADRLATTFAHDQRHAEHYSQRRAHRTSFPERLAQSTARLLSPLL